MLTPRHLLATTLAALGSAASRTAEQEVEEASQVLPLGLEPLLVSIPPGYAPGEMHVDPNTFTLFWTLQDDTAIRHPCGIGRPGLYESGGFFVGPKKEWPSWTPTPDMIAREPEHHAQYADGMPGGPENPLGARALPLHPRARQHVLADSRDQRPCDYRDGRLERLRAARQRADHRSLERGACRYARRA